MISIPGPPTGIRAEPLAKEPFLDVFTYDAFDVISLLLDGAGPVVALDVGANIGDLSVRLLHELPGASVFAFEPVPETFARLQSRAASSPGLHPVHAAVGDREGQVQIRVLSDDRFSSVLPMSVECAGRYGPLSDQVATVNAPLVRLDDWASRYGVTNVHVMKVDVQGLELDVLRGARRLLTDQLLAVKAEAQLIPQYEGAATFSDIDLELRSRGFVLHQIHELWPLGNERQHVCVDALWLKPTMLNALRVLTRGDATLERLIGFRRMLRTLASEGVQRLALYGGGRHTRSLSPVIERSPVHVSCIIEDRTDLHGQSVAGLPIVSRNQALHMNLDAVVLSSDQFEADLWRSAQPLRTAGIRVEPLYEHHPLCA